MTTQIEKTSVACGIEDFLRHCRFERKLDKKTIAAYNTDLLQFIKIGAIDSEGEIEQITREKIKVWLESMESYKFRTIKRKLASTRAFLRYLETEHDDFNNPIRKMQIKLKEPVRLPVVMTKDEVKKILTQLEEESSSKPNSRQANFMAVRNRAVVELLFATGMRIGELCNLRHNDVDLEHRIVHILGKGNRERVVDICLPVTLNALHEWVAVRPSLHNTPGEYFFINRLGDGLSPQTVRSLIHSLADECGISKHVTPHTFRHTFATLLLEEDVDIANIKQILGHSSIATTQIYLHVNPVRQREILTHRHPRSKMI